MSSLFVRQSGSVPHRNMRGMLCIVLVGPLLLWITIEAFVPRPWISATPRIKTRSAAPIPTYNFNKARIRHRDSLARKLVVARFGVLRPPDDSRDSQYSSLERNSEDESGVEEFEEDQEEDAPLFDDDFAPDDDGGKFGPFSLISQIPRSPADAWKYKERVQRSAKEEEARLDALLRFVDFTDPTNPEIPEPLREEYGLNELDQPVEAPSESSDAAEDGAPRKQKHYRWLFELTDEDNGLEDPVVPWADDPKDAAES